MMKSLVHACKFFLGLELPFSQVTERELALLLKHSREAEVLVEIGCYEGRTTAALAGNSHGTVYSVDPFFKGRLGICYGELIAHSHCRRNKAGNVRFLKGLSWEVAPNFESEIDFLFIDADHSYEAIRKDWETWVPKMRKGGVVALHDCKRAPNSPDYLGSMKFYDEDIPKIEGIDELDGIDSLVLFRVQQR